MDLIWLVPCLPLFGFAALVVAGRRLGDPAAGWFATAMVGASFVVSVVVYADLASRPEEDRVFTQTLFTWIPAGSFDVSIGFLVDPLSILMCLFVTGIGALIHLYSVGYMKGDPNFSKFFVYLNLFIASMLLLVLGDNLLLTFLGWEGVGACSYLLISFWFTDPANASAGKKAFVTNRIGDVGFMLGTFLVWVTIGSVNYLDIRLDAPRIATGTAIAIGLLFFLGAVGKSAQLPLFVWLPDAMAGPTPVSALIHAATMVTAGIYLITRLNPIMAQADWANDVIAWTGALTALVAALAAVAQTDIKRVLAYSTISQLGYMFLAVGTQTYVAGVFHMVTHAFFKALLFLGAGAVIHSMAHEQDMRRYGNLRKYLPITFVTFFVGWLSIAGVPPMSGFWSKDEVLAGAFASGTDGRILWVIGLAVAALTAFYMTRQLILVFYGEERWREQETDPAAAEVEDADTEDAAALTSAAGHDEHHLTPEHEPHESPWTMLLPLCVLAGLTAVAGVLNLPFSDEFHLLEEWLYPVIVFENELPAAPVLFGLASGAVTTAAIGIWFGWFVYQRKRVDASRIEQPVLLDAFHIDDAYAAVAGGPGEMAFQGAADFDSTIVDGAVDAVGAVAVGSGNRLRRLQNGLVRSYALGIAGGAALLLVYVVMRMNL